MRGLDFTAIDFETANAKRGSACAVGLAKVRDGVVVDTASWLIEPPPSVGHFAAINTSVHGITASDVRSAPGWQQSLRRIMAFAAGDAFVAHNASFDRSVLRGACIESGVPVPDVVFHCSVDLARRHLDLDGHRLPQVARALGLGGFTHHDAGSDAEVCAATVVALARRGGLASLAELWPAGPAAVRRAGPPAVRRAGPPAVRRAVPPAVRRAGPPAVRRAVPPVGPLSGQIVVFTGDLATLSRAEAIELVTAAGATPAQNVTKRTTMIVVGRQDPRRDAVTLTDATAKERKALQYRLAGQAIRPVGEHELRTWLGLELPRTAPDALLPGTLEAAVTGLLSWIGRGKVG